MNLTAIQELDGRLLVAFLMGVAVASIAFLVENRLDQEPVLVKATATDVVDAYKRGRRDALTLRPVNWELEQACLSMWANSQPYGGENESN